MFKLMPVAERSVAAQQSFQQQTSQQLATFNRTVGVCMPEPRIHRSVSSI
ncbi:hypothetical protein LMG28727_05248 [Paraburkholderia kirstenboschensis]|nr:hypothetical protein [Paraburkholderia kirstenboschensis]CAD6551549.1 hypothetical protein LMG28727_05248 [Paraburkholderia kirstenboschensis]